MGGTRAPGVLLLGALWLGTIKNDKFSARSVTGKLILQVTAALRSIGLR